MSKREQVLDLVRLIRRALQCLLAAVGQYRLSFLLDLMGGTEENSRPSPLERGLEHHGPHNREEQYQVQGVQVSDAPLEAHYAGVIL